MNHWTRFAYAFALTIGLGVVILIALAFVSKEMAYTFLYDYYWAAIFILGYFIAPLLGRLFKRGQISKSPESKSP